MEIITNQQVKMANQVELISTSIVTMANSNAHISRVELTPWDLRLLSIDQIQKGLLFYKPESTSQEFEKTVIDRLKDTLSQALDFFPPLAGRLAQIKNGDTNTSHFFVDCNNAGASFTHAIAHGMHACDILDPVHTPTIVRSFFPLSGLRNYDGIANPLLAVQVTELVDSIFIACTINHCVADGTSFWHFFNSWSEICRGSSEISKLPLFERSSVNELSFINYPVQVPPFELINLQENTSQPLCTERMFHFGKAGLSKLKARTNREAGSDKISTLQALVAHTWRAIVRNWGVVQPDNMQLCVVIIGTRGRLSLPENYFGNAIYFTYVTMVNKNLVQEEPGCIALEMNKLVSMQTRDHILQDIGKNVQVIRTDPAMLKQTVAIGSTPRHNVYGVDFGWGKAVAVRSGPAAKFNGMVNVYPSADGEGIDVEVCLATESMVAIKNDAEFMDPLTF